MTTSRVTPSKWMYTDGDAAIAEDKIIKKPGGWYKINRKGLLELIHCLTTIGNVSPTILSVTNMADDVYTRNTALSFSLVFSEIVNVTTTGGTPSIQVYTEEGVLIDLAYASGTGTDTLVFTGIPGATLADGDLMVDLIADDNGGDMLDSSLNNVDPRFPTDYVQPTIEIRTPVILSVTNHADGTYDDAIVLTFTVLWSESMEVTGVPVLQVTSGATVGLPYTAGDGTATWTFAGATTGVTAGLLEVELALALSAGTIISTTDALVAELDFPAGYVQPAITITTV